jgi:hypothetical protein
MDSLAHDRQDEPAVNTQTSRLTKIIGWESSRGEQNPCLLSVGCSKPFRAPAQGQSQNFVRFSV